MYIKYSAVLLVISSLVGCGGSSGDGDTIVDGDTDQSIIAIDASSRDSYVYYKLDDFTQVTPADPSTDTEWDIAFRRTSILLNSGASGSADIEGALGVTPDGFYDSSDEAVASVFLNASTEQEGQTAFEAVIVPESLEYTQDTNSNAINDDWYVYSGAPNYTVTANSDNYWIVRSQSGDSYAKVRVTDLVQTGRTISSITIGVDLQAVSESAFSGVENLVDLDLSSGIVCYDFDVAIAGDCSDNEWDLRIDPSLSIWLNSDVYGNGQGAIAYGASLESTSSTLINTVDGATVRQWIKDETAGVFDANSWFAYNLQNENKLWPNYRVYVIKDGDDYHKLQVQSYYNSEGTSGHYTLRSEKIN